MKINNICINKNKKIKDAIMIMDSLRTHTLFVLDDNDKLFGIITDGDIRRAIMNGIDVEFTIRGITNKQPIINENDAVNILSNDINDIVIPIIDNNGNVLDGMIISRNKTSMKISNGKIDNIKRILIIGGAGYLGSVLSKMLLEKNYIVRVLDNLTYGDEGISDLYNNQNFEFINGDIRDIQIIVEALKGVDAVIHLAAIVGDSASNLNPEETIEINYLATKMIADICRYSQINRFIFASTCSVYGTNKTNIPLTETSSLNPISLYAKMKLKSEYGILETIDETFSPTILRMGTLYGVSSRMRFDLVLNALTIRAHKEKKFTIFGGEQWRPFLHVKDAARAYIECLNSPIEKVRGEIFNVMNENLQINDVSKKICEYIPNVEMIIDDKQIDKRNYIASSKKIKNAIDFDAKLNVDYGIIEIKPDDYNNYKDVKYSNYAYLKEI